MDLLERMQIYKVLRDLSGAYRNELFLNWENESQLIWDSGDRIYAVTIDHATCREAWESLPELFDDDRFRVSDRNGWKEDKAFLKDMFWAHFDSLEILPE